LVLSEKKKRVEKLEQTKEEFFKKKREVFESAKNDKLLLETMASQYNSHMLNKNNYKYIKIKHELIEGRTYRFKKKAEKEENAKIKFDDKLQKGKEEKEILLQKLKILEEAEVKCLESLKKTLRCKETEIAKLNLNKENNANIQSVNLHNQEKSRDILTTVLANNKKSVRNKSVMTPQKLKKKLHENKWR
jgi:hypothetical protein